ncbi:MAG TPA: lipoprotein [Mizugakiibacter sp.]
MRRALIVLPLLAAALAGCGNKGPLVLPTKPTAPAPAASAAPASPGSAVPAPAASVAPAPASSSG